MQKTERIWLDGALVPWDEAQVHVMTHTLHYGLGVFEGIRCYEGADGRLGHLPAARASRSPVRIGPHPRSRHAVHARGAGGGVSRHRPRQSPARVLPTSDRISGRRRHGPVGATGDAGRDRRVAVGRVSRRRGRCGTVSDSRPAPSSASIPNTLLTKAKAVGHYVNSILAAQEARARRLRRGPAARRRRLRLGGERREHLHRQQGIVKTTPLPTVLGGITRDAALRLLGDARRRDPRGALHA